MKDPNLLIWLCNFSESGTFLNGSRILHDPIQIRTGDVFYLLYSPDYPSQSVGFNLEILCDLPDSSSTNSPSVLPPSATRSGAISGASNTANELESYLSCLICGNIFYTCCSLQPCLHSFCTLCWLQWKQVMNICPICRQPVREYAKNHQLNSLVELFLRELPSKAKRDEEKKKWDEDLAALKAADAVATEGATQHSGLRHPRPANPFTLACVVCGWHRGMSTGPPYCSSHNACACCGRLVPSYQGGLSHVNNVECESCRRSFCALVASGGCQGCGTSCLSRISDMKNLPALPPGLLLGNTVETAIVTDYLSEKNISTSDFVTACLDHLDPSLFGGRSVDLDPLLCRDCSTRCLSHLAYQWRLSLPATELPQHVVSRPDCHYGRYCRTQRSSAIHANRYNHICDRTRP
ncbi:unnamed protein product [Dicrocoelium dendriticum]|nr:unnamed protein product [Dicrocoelium dendriticum]